MRTIEVIGVIGAGAMGRGIAQVLLSCGKTVLLADSNKQVLTEAKAFIMDKLHKQAAKGRLTKVTATQAEAALSLISTDALGKLENCQLVVEAIVEHHSAKAELFEQLEHIVSADCILATNTSSLSVTGLAATCQHPARVAGWHFFNPVPLMRLVEVIGAVQTAPDVLEHLTALTREFGHTPVNVKDMPGFLVNHVGRGYGGEALHIVAEQVADYACIDRILKRQCGFKMGPFELFDLTGLDISHRVTESIYQQFYYDPRYRPSVIAQQRVQAGLLGRKSQHGFYDYDNANATSPGSVVIPNGSLEAVWLGACDDKVRSWLTALLEDTGIKIESDLQPSGTALIIIAPWGSDATHFASLNNLDSQRTIAIDPLFPESGQLVLMATVNTRPDYRDGAHALFAQTGQQVEVINDSCGFVSQRILACIINIACEMVQRGIASICDIDQAMQAALGYPNGAFGWAEIIGPARVLTILENLFEQMGDPRYRPSIWLKRRVQTGQPLLREESSC